MFLMLEGVSNKLKKISRAWDSQALLKNGYLVEQKNIWGNS